MLNTISFPKIKKILLSKKPDRKTLKYINILSTLTHIAIFITVSYASSSGGSENLATIVDLIDKVQKGAEWLIGGIIVIQGLFQIYEANLEISGCVTAFMEAWVKWALFQGILNAVRTFFGSGTMLF